MAESATTTVELLGDRVEYEVRRSDRATKARIDVGIRGVTVVIPAGVDRDPDSLLLENAAWVVEKIAEFDTYRKQIPDRNYEEGEAFKFLGEPHEVVIEKRSSSDVEDGQLLLAEHHVEQTSVKRALETLYRRKARERFQDRADHYAAEMGVEYEKIEVRNQRTKWGSCSTSGTLGLNWRLMMAPPDVVDYVVLHEIAHLVEPNHNDEFWELVAPYDSDYAEHAAWLEENSAKLVFSEDDY